MKDLTRLGGNGRRQIRRTDSDRALREKERSSEWRRDHKPFSEIPGYGDPKPEELENNNEQQ